jgi:hypothetical protein
LFLLSAGAILGLTGIAKLLSFWGNTVLLEASDPIIGFPIKWIMLMLGIVELSVAYFCVHDSEGRLASFLVAWLSTSILAYRFLLWLGDWHRPCRCLGSLMDYTPISPETTDTIMRLVLVYLLFGSYTTTFEQCRLLKTNGRNLFSLMKP